MSPIGESPAPEQTGSRRCAQCGRFKQSSAGMMCARCAPPHLDELVQPGDRVEPHPVGERPSLVEPSVQPTLTAAERAVLFGHARDDFVVPRPSQLHSATVVSPGLRVPATAPPPAGPTGSAAAEHVAVGRAGRGRSRLRTAMISLVLILIGVAVAAAIPLLLSLLGS